VGGEDFYSPSKLWWWHYRLGMSSHSYHFSPMSQADSMARKAQILHS
jgi:hypothetical protein